MTRHILIFVVCFLIGAAATAAIRTARHEPFAMPAPAAPSQVPAPSPAAVAAPAAPTATAAQAAPVNTICAICGMEVDPQIPTALYQGKVIGFGCRMCPAKFAADPEHYGPAFLRNAVVEP